MLTFFKNNFKKILAANISIALGLIFIYSGYTKLLPLIETIEFTFVDIGIANWYTAPIIARLLVGLELFVGLLLILNYNLKKFTLPLTVGLLLFFILYLIGLLIFSGNSVNCGCFGEHHRMTPVQGIIKNIIMIVGALLVYFFHEGWKLKMNALFLSFVGFSVFITPFIINPIDYAYTSNNLDEKINYPLELNLLYEQEDTSKVEIPKTELRKGKQVLAFLSLTCTHCRIAAKKFRLIKKQNPAIPIYFILNGDKKNYQSFIADTKADNIPSSYCLGKTFIQLASAQLPRIYYLDNGMVVKKVDYFELNQYQIENWLKSK
jgi:uncharacterized membrane protein YphA (DoxX/SURF4 family)